MVLAICSVIAGFAGVPRFMGGNNAIEGWLAPAVTAGFAHEAHGLEAAAGEAAHAAHSVAAEWAVTLSHSCRGLGTVAGTPVLRPTAGAGHARRGSLRGAAPGARAEVWVDEVYDAVVVRPIRFSSEQILWRIVDVRIIDGLVNLLARFTKAFSYLFRFFQSGYVQTYVLVLVLGVLALLLRAI